MCMYIYIKGFFFCVCVGFLCVYICAHQTPQTPVLRRWSLLRRRKLGLARSALFLLSSIIFQQEEAAAKQFRQWPSVSASSRLLM